MADEPTQHTPKGAEIPVPKRDRVLRDFERITQPEDKPKRSRRKRQRGQKK